ncbi:hypothetical protein D3C80_2074690 [compost metagenome]
MLNFIDDDQLYTQGFRQTVEALQQGTGCPFIRLWITTGLQQPRQDVVHGHAGLQGGVEDRSLCPIFPFYVRERLAVCINDCRFTGTAFAE